MLKLLLGHWKAHKKKPSLLPEDGDVYFEDPATINPLFEDSDSSISSTKGRPDSPHGENQTVTQVENEQTQNEADVPVINELIDVTVPTHSKDSVISDSKISVDKSADAKHNNSPSITKDIPEIDSSGNNEPSVKLESNIEDASVSPLEPKPKNETVLSIEPVAASHSDSTDKTAKSDINREEIEGEEKMRLYNQPSTSAMRENKKPSSNDTIVKDSTISSPKPTDLQKDNSSVNHEQTPKSNKPNKLDSIVHSSSPLRPSREKSLPSSQPDPPDKPAKLRAKAIEELMKKFQGPSTESDNVTNEVTKSSSTEVAVEKKHLPKTSPKVETSSKKIPNQKDQNPSSPPIQSKENVNKITKPVNKESLKPNKPSTETVSRIRNDQEIEALSNIFTFPPPPPAEPLPNKSSLHGKILKEHKFNNQLIKPGKSKESVEDSKEVTPGKTRSDSSLDRTRTVSSIKAKENVEQIEKHTAKEISNKNQAISQEETSKKVITDEKSSTNHSLIEKSGKAHENTNEILTEVKTTKQNKPSVSNVQSSKEKLDSKLNLESEKIEPEPLISNDSASKERESPVPKPKASLSFLHKNYSISTETNAVKSTVPKQKSSISKASDLSQCPLNDKENVKSHSEDSGITRGDQISSETTQETPLDNLDNLPEESNSNQNPPRKTKKEKKLKSGNKKPCKHCKPGHLDNGSIRRSQYDEYYDGLTGIRHLHKGKHSDSWTSELSWEERELLRRLRSRKGTVRSSTPSTRSRHSRHRFKDERHFHRHHNYRRSISDDSTFYGSSLSSCDECWAQYVRDYFYGRASLRGMSPIQEVCTCKTSPHNFLGRRVKFRADTIPEASQSKRTSRSSTPAPPTENKEAEEDEGSSQTSSKTKDGDSSVHTNLEVSKDKKSNSSEEAYRFMTPWELEEWNLLMRKQLLHKRRRRARCMGLMALAMVVFIGLVVTILMVYLRRKVI